MRPRYFVRRVHPKGFEWVSCDAEATRLLAGEWPWPQDIADMEAANHRRLAAVFFGDRYNVIFRDTKGIYDFKGEPIQGEHGTTDE